MFLHQFKLGELFLLTTGRLFAPKHSEWKARVSLEEYRSNLMEMIRIARENRIAIVLLTRPFVGPVENQRNWKNAAYDYNAATVEIANKEKVPLIDLYSYFKAQDQFFADESHFNREGIRIAAQIVFQSLQPVIYP